MPYGTMTAGGVASLLLVRGELMGLSRLRSKTAERARVAIRDGLAWLQDYIPKNPSGHYRRTGGTSAEFDFYFLYGLERIGVLGHLRRIGTIDWYVDGAERLLGSQRPDGSWGDNTVLDTTWAVLFLKRASFRARRGETTRSEPGPGAAPEPGTVPGGSAPPAAPGPGLEQALAFLRGGILTTEDGYERDDADRVRVGLDLLLRARDLFAPASVDPKGTDEDRAEALGCLTDLEARIEEARAWLAGPPESAPAPVPIPPGPPPVLAPVESEPPRPEPAAPRAAPPSPGPAQGSPRAPAVAPDLPPTSEFQGLSRWCEAVDRVHAATASADARASITDRMVSRAGVLALPVLLRWFEDETDPAARDAAHAALARIGTSRVALAMGGYARSVAPPQVANALDVIYRCLEKPESAERERPFMRAIRRFHLLRDRRLSRGIVDRLYAMGPEGVAALGEVLYVPDFGLHDLTIARLATCKDRRAVPPLVFKMNRFVFEDRIRMPAHLALIQIGWYAVPALIDRLDDRAAGTWISWTLRKITGETMGTTKLRWYDWWKTERLRHPEVLDAEEAPPPAPPQAPPPPAPPIPETPRGPR